MPRARCHARWARACQLQRNGLCWRRRRFGRTPRRQGQKIAAPAALASSGDAVELVLGRRPGGPEPSTQRASKKGFAWKDKCGLSRRALPTFPDSCVGPAPATQQAWSGIAQGHTDPRLPSPRRPGSPTKRLSLSRDASIVALLLFPPPSLANSSLSPVAQAFARRPKRARRDVTFETCAAIG
jgi:hypothetical protein